MKCPVCKTDLMVVEREGIEVDWCLDCGGIWFDEGEIELLGEKAGRSIAAQILESPNDLPTKGRRFAGFNSQTRPDLRHHVACGVAI